MEIKWLTPEEAGIKWGIKTRRVQALCSNGQIPDAVRKGRMWLIPQNTLKPVDGRTKAARQKNDYSDTNKHKEELTIAFSKSEVDNG